VLVEAGVPGMRGWPKQVNLLLLGSYVLLSIGAAASFAFYILLPTSLEGWRAFGLSLGTEIVGILLTVLLIDAVIRRKEARDQERYRRIALRQLRIPLTHHLRLLSNMYKASVERKPDREIASLQDLFSEDYFEQITYFNAMGPSPAAPPPLDPDFLAKDKRPPPIPWYQYLSTEVEHFKKDLEDVVDNYGRHLDPDTLDLLAQLSRSGFVNSVGHLPLTATMLRGWGHQGAHNPFVVEPDMPLMRDHARAFSKLVDIYNEEAPDDRKVRIRGNIWSDNSAPAIGSSRAPYSREAPGQRTAGKGRETEQNSETEQSADTEQNVGTEKSTGSEQSVE
jgi:hypothetical protein